METKYKLTKDDARYIGVPKEFLSYNLSNDYEEEGLLLKKLIINKLKDNFFPGKVLKIDKLNLFYTLSLAIYHKLAEMDIINSVRVVCLQELVEMSGMKLKDIVNDKSIGYGSLKVISIIDFDSDSSDYINNRSLIQGFIKKWLDSGRSVLIHSEKNYKDLHYDNWLINFMRYKTVGADI